jgi:hypothetical protein
MEDKYKILQESDWNKGNESKMLPLDRVRMHTLWLEKMHEEMLHVEQHVPNNDQPVVGFPD